MLKKEHDLHLRKKEYTLEEDKALKSQKMKK
jgi:hypothetical protein